MYFAKRLQSLLVGLTLLIPAFQAGTVLQPAVLATVTVSALVASAPAQAAFRAAASANTVAEPTMTVTKPTGTVDNDIVIVCATFDGSAGTISTPAGWTAAAANPITVTADGQRGWCFYHVAASDGASYAFTTNLNGASSGNWHAVSLSGRNTSTPITFQNSGSSNTASASPRTTSTSSGTAATGDDLVFFQFLDNQGSVSATFTAPSTFTEATDVTDAGSSSSSMDYKENVSSGAVGTVSGTGTYTTVNAGYGAIIFAVAQAAGGGGISVPVAYQHLRQQHQ
jgi:hypothetical protein